MTSEKRSINSLFYSYLPEYIALLLIALAFLTAFHSTLGLNQPVEIDLYRDMGAAQSILDGAGNADPSYLDEIRWYNPLLPYVMASLSKIGGWRLPCLFTHAGVFLNIIGPICFYLFVSFCCGRWAALGALSAYLFFANPNQSPWFHAAYSAWLWPFNFTQGLSFMCLAAYLKALKSDEYKWTVLTGILLGLVMLAHTAPTLIIAVTVVLISLYGILVERRAKHSLKKLIIIGCISIFVSSPFLFPILIRYQFKIMNSAPGNYIGMHFSDIFRELITLRFPFAMVGGIALLFKIKRQEFDPRTRTFLVMLIVATLIFFGYGLLSQLLIKLKTNIILPLIVPTFHFHIYFSAWICLLFGVGLWLFSNAITQILIRKKNPNCEYYSKWTFCLILLLFVSFLYPTYRNSYDFIHFRKESIKFELEKGRVDFYNWILANTNPKDVFLADNTLSMYAIVPAGRKTIVLIENFSNPYVNYKDRFNDRKSMYESLQMHDMNRFKSISDKYSLTYIISNNNQSSENIRPDYCWIPESFYAGNIQLVYRNDMLSVYQIL